MLAELKKHWGLREVRVGYLLGMVFLAVGLHVNRISRGTSITWVSVQNDIWSYGATLTAFLLAVGLSRLFGCETDWGTEPLVRVTARGAWHTFWSKTGFTVFYCAGVVLVVGGASLLVHGTGFALYGALEPAETIVTDLRLPMTNLGYCTMQYGMLFVGALYFAGFVLLLSVLTRRTALTVVLSGGAYALCAVYGYVGRYWVSGAGARLLEGLFKWSICGYLIQDADKLAQLYTNGAGEWLLCGMGMIVLEFLLLWLLWRRRARV